jgi:hypothetical protein
MVAMFASKEVRRLINPDRSDPMGWPEAMYDAATLIRGNDLPGRPQIVISEDGIVTMEWHRGDRGAVLLFLGDGTVAMSLRQPGRGYAENSESMSVMGKIPPMFIGAIAQLES